MTRFVAVLLTLAGSALATAEEPRLLIAFASYRERPLHPKVYFYEHDGVATGKIAGSIDTADKRSDYHPSLSHDGRYCAFAAELESERGGVQVWDRKERKLLDLPKLNETPNLQLGPSLTADGRLLAFSAWDRPGLGSRWGLGLYDTTDRKLLDLPGLVGAEDRRMPALSGDGRWLAFTTNARGGAGLTDVGLYDRVEKKSVSLPGLNSAGSDVEPSLSADGRWLAFTSDRPAGQGGRDVYLYDRSEKKLVALPGLNAVGHDQSPSLSPDGRFLVFVSERLGGEGERDVYLYDRQKQKLLPTPGLNARQEDIDPCVIIVR